MSKFGDKTTFSLLNIWASFKKKRWERPDNFGPEDSSWLSVLDREQMIEELFVRLGELSLSGSAC